jgi:hypothetical protein
VRRRTQRTQRIRGEGEGVLCALKTNADHELQFSPRQRALVSAELQRAVTYIGSSS